MGFDTIEIYLVFRTLSNGWVVGSNENITMSTQDKVVVEVGVELGNSNILTSHSISDRPALYNRYPTWNCWGMAKHFIARHGTSKKLEDGYLVGGYYLDCMTWVKLNLIITLSKSELKWLR